MIRAIWEAFWREWRRIVSDGGALLILVGAIVIYAIVYPIPYLPEVLSEVPTAVVDLDRTSLSRTLTQMLDADPLVRVVASPASRAEAEALLRDGSVEAIVVIPEGFRRSVVRGEPAWVGAWVSGTYFLAYRQVVTGIVEAAGTLSAGIEIRRLELQGLTPDEARNARDPVGLAVRPLFNATEGYASYVVPAVLVLILQQTLLIGIGLLSGTAHRRGEPVPAGLAAIVAATLGRGAAYVALYAVHAIFYFGVVIPLFDFPGHGSPLGVAAFFIPFIAAVTFLGLAIGQLFREREVAIPALLFTSLPAIFLAGFSWPPEQIPRWLRLASLALPSTTGIPGFLRLTAMGAGLGDVRQEIGLLAGLTAAYFVAACAIAWWRARRTTGSIPV